MVKCPFPGCSHSGEILTNHHCETAHGMTKNALQREYGVSKHISRSQQAERANKLNYAPIGQVNPGYPGESESAKEKREYKRNGHLAAVQTLQQIRRAKR